MIITNEVVDKQIVYVYDQQEQPATNTNTNTAGAGTSTTTKLGDGLGTTTIDTSTTTATATAASGSSTSTTSGATTTTTSTGSLPLSGATATTTANNNNNGQTYAPCGEDGVLTGVVIRPGIIRACNGAHYDVQGRRIHYKRQGMTDVPFYTDQDRLAADVAMDVGDRVTFGDKYQDDAGRSHRSYERVGNGPTPIMPPPADLAPPVNTHMIIDCAASVDESALDDFHAPSGEDEAIYEIYYSNPPRTCGTVVEIGAGDGYYHSKSYFFETALRWRTLLVEANPNTFRTLLTNRPNTPKVNGAFCEGDRLTFLGDANAFRGTRGDNEVSSEKQSLVETSDNGNSHNEEEDQQGGVAVPCLSLRPVLRAHGVAEHIDVLFVAVEGDALAVLRAMDWTVRVDVWVIELDDDDVRPERKVAVRDLLTDNDYVRAEWDVRRWCNPYMMGSCVPNEVWLQRGHRPIDVDRARRRLEAVHDDRERRRGRSLRGSGGDVRRPIA